jgi:osmotically-inducible protein OsmY
MDPRTRGVGVTVVAEDGIVTITGETRFAEVNQTLQAVARHVDGVTEVRSKVLCTSDRPERLTRSNV